MKKHNEDNKKSIYRIDYDETVIFKEKKDKMGCYCSENR